MALQKRPLKPAPVTKKTVTKPAPAAPATRKANGAAPINSSASVEEGYLNVIRTFKKGGEIVGSDEKQETLLSKKFTGETARMAMGLSRTIPTGDYEGVKVSLTVSVPCYLEELDDAQAFVSEKTNAYLMAELEKLGLDETHATDTEAGEGTEAAEESEEAEEGEAADDGDLTIETADDVMALDRKTLVSIIESESLDIDPDEKKYKKDDVLAKAVADALGLEPAEAGEEAEGEEAEEGEAGEDGDKYTQKELEGFGEDDLKEIYESWDLGTFPKGVPKARKAAAIKTILEAQNA